MFFDKKIIPNRRKIIFAVLVIAALMAGFFKYRGSIINLYNSFFKPSGGVEKEIANETMSDSDKLFKSDFWQSLRFYGQLPIVPRVTGRAIPFPATDGAADTAGTRDALRVSHAITIVSALARYYQNMNKYPIAESAEVGSEEAYCLAPAGWLRERDCEEAENKYLDSAPRDPGSSKYLYTSDGASYTIKVNLETAKPLEYSVDATERP